MDHAAPRTDRRLGRLAVVASAALLIVAACGGAAGSEGGGGADAQKVIAEAQFAFGTSMIEGSVEGTTVTLVIVNGFGSAGVGLFMCSNVKDSLAKHDPNGTLTVIAVDQDGNQLSSSADCP
jgi:hypothetical protein